MKGGEPGPIDRVSTPTYGDDGGELLALSTTIGRPELTTCPRPRYRGAPCRLLPSCARCSASLSCCLPAQRWHRRRRTARAPSCTRALSGASCCTRQPGRRV